MKHALFERPVFVQLVQWAYSFFGMVSRGGVGYCASTGVTVAERTSYVCPNWQGIVQEVAGREV